MVSMVRLEHLLTASMMPAYENGAGVPSMGSHTPFMMVVEQTIKIGMMILII